MESHALDGLARMGECITHQAQVMRIQLNGFVRRQRLIVKHVEVAQNTTIGPASPMAHEAEPTGQPQERKRSGYGLI
jgi:hypothetical protein